MSDWATSGELPHHTGPRDEPDHDMPNHYVNGLYWSDALDPLWYSMTDRPCKKLQDCLEELFRSAASGDVCEEASAELIKQIRVSAREIAEAKWIELENCEKIDFLRMY